MTKKFSLPYAEFYITNVCNLTCVGCNRFNNVKFKGWQNWNEYKETYRRWSEELELGSISILGGEPLLNPTFTDWVLGLRELWPQAQLRIASNGTQLDNHHAFYKILQNDPKIRFSVCLHNKIHKQHLIDKVKNFMVGPFESKFDPTPYRECLTLTDANGVQIDIWHNWWFHQGALITSETGFKLHESDPVKAHNNCHMKTCHHFIRGKLYKCGVVALLPEFDKQHSLLLPDHDRNILENYQPLQIDDDTDTKLSFIKKLSDPIPQCKFCPEVYHGEQIFAIEKRDLKV